MKILHFVYMVIIFSSFPAISGEVQSEMIEFVKKDQLYNCEEKREEIEGLLSIPQQCTYDGDCQYFNYGYPWQPEPCVKAIVSKAEKKTTLKNLVKIEEYNQKCINKSDEEVKKYTDFVEKNNKAECNMIRLYCYKDYCRSKNYSVHINYDTPLRQLR